MKGATGTPMQVRRRKPKTTAKPWRKYLRIKHGAPGERSMVWAKVCPKVVYVSAHLKGGNYVVWQRSRFFEHFRSPRTTE